jgi:uncharacterized Zn finger protein
VLHGRLSADGRRFQGTVRCKACGAVHRSVHEEARMRTLPLLVSWMERTGRHAWEVEEGRALAVGERYEAAGGRVEITSLEAGGRRVQRATAGSVDAVWARRVDEVRVRAAVTRGARTYSRNLFAAPDEEFTVGEMLELGRDRVLVARIQLAGKMLTEGAAKAERIVRLLCKPMRAPRPEWRPRRGGASRGPRSRPRR